MSDDELTFIDICYEWSLRHAFGRDVTKISINDLLSMEVKVAPTNYLTFVLLSHLHESGGIECSMEAKGAAEQAEYSGSVSLKKHLREQNLSRLEKLDRLIQEKRVSPDAGLTQEQRRLMESLVLAELWGHAIMAGGECGIRVTGRYLHPVILRGIESPCSIAEIAYFIKRVIHEHSISKNKRVDISMEEALGMAVDLKNYYESYSLSPVSDNNTHTFTSNNRLSEAFFERACGLNGWALHTRLPWGFKTN